MLAVPEEEEVARVVPVDKRGDRWTDGIGHRARFDPDYVTPGGVRFTSNWQIKCLNPLHPRRCFKKRHINADSTSRCGDIEPLAFLHVWAAGEGRDGKPHSRTDTAIEDVVAYAESHGEELREVLARGVALIG